MTDILLIVPSMASVGGAEKLMTTLSSLLNDNYTISIASFDQDGITPFFQTSSKFYPLGECRQLPIALRFIAYIQAARKLSRLKRRLEPSVSISVLWRADLINSLTKRKDEKLISLFVINVLNNPSNSLLIKFKDLASLVYRRFDKVLAIAPPILWELKSLFRISPDKISVFKSFVEPTDSLSPYICNRRRFVFCGRAVHEKNIEGLLHVFKLFNSRLNSHQLVIIGDGPLLESMIVLAKYLGLSVSNYADSTAQVVFLGSITEPEIYMRGAIALLLTSRDEGLPTVLIQAAALGLPILASDCQGGGVQYLFKDSLNDDLSDNELSRLLLPVPDPSQQNTLESWAYAMELVDSNEANRTYMLNISRLISKKYNKKSVKSDWLSLIDSIIAK